MLFLIALNIVIDLFLAFKCSSQMEFKVRLVVGCMYVEMSDCLSCIFENKNHKSSYLLDNGEHKT